MSQKYAPNLRKSLYWHIESSKSIEDFLREVDEDLVIYDGEFQSKDRRGNFTFGRESFKVVNKKGLTERYECNVTFQVCRI